MRFTPVKNTTNKSEASLAFTFLLERNDSSDPSWCRREREPQDIPCSQYFNPNVQKNCWISLNFDTHPTHPYPHTHIHTLARWYRNPLISARFFTTLCRPPVRTPPLGNYKWGDASGEGPGFRSSMTYLSPVRTPPLGNYKWRDASGEIVEHFTFF